MIPVKVSGLSLSKVGFVLLLQGGDDKRTLPIFIGAAEAQSIAIHLSGTAVPRPLTHDLFKNMLDCLECRLKRIEVHSLEENTFFARLILERDGLEFELDSRPSDAIALALRCEAPIFVAPQVMAQAGVVIDEKQTAEKGHAPEHPKATEQAHLAPIEALKKQLAQAVKDERYEDAAKLRDDIQRLEHPHSPN